MNITKIYLNEIFRTEQILDAPRPVLFMGKIVRFKYLGPMYKYSFERPYAFVLEQS